MRQRAPRLLTSLRSWTAAHRRILEVGLPPLATAVLFWVVQRLDLVTDTPLWVLYLTLALAFAVNEVTRALVPRSVTARVVVMVAGIGSVIYATGWGPVLVVGFMYGIAAGVRRHGSAVVLPAFLAVVAAVAVGQTAVALDIAPSLVGERLSHGLAALGILGLLFPSWVIHTTAAKKEETEAHLLRQSLEDPLTRLPNRTFFVERLDRALSRAAGDGRSVGVIFFDLDRFKLVNDSLGHEVGDLLLVSVAERIVTCVRPTDVVARLGGDEFTVLIEDLEDAAAAVRVVDRIRDELRLPFLLQGYEVVVGVSAGIAVGSPGVAGDDLIRHADVAMYQAKRRGGNRYEIFGREMEREAFRRLELETLLRRAIRERRVRLHYQAEVALNDGRVSGVEALARWFGDDGAEAPLDDVIAVAEETGLIVPLGRYLLEDACEDGRAWADALGERSGLQPMPEVAVNVSPRQFEHPDLVGQVSTTLSATGLQPARLRLEIVEEAVMAVPSRGREYLEGLKALGVRLALDDFGSGRSSLASLGDLPVDVVKLDRSLVERILVDDNMLAVVEAAVTMAHRLGLWVVAVGVETVEQLLRLRELGCDACQGYLFSAPVPAVEAGALIRRGRYPLEDLIGFRG